MSGIIFKNAGDNYAGEAVAAGVITGLIASLNAALFYKKGEFMIKTLKGEEIDPSEKLKQIRTTNLVTNLTVIGSTLNRYYLSNKKRIKPAAVLAGIPLGSVEELSSALSDRILKYRAIGGIFLAHQDGGNESLRIVCKAWGIGRYLFLTMIDFLFMYGSAKILDLFKGINLFGQTTAGLGEITKDIFGKSVQKRNPWKRFDEMNKDEGREEYHSTFPIVTKNRIYSSMYLETYDIVETVNVGMNMLTVTLFLRKYRPPYPLEMTNVKKGKKGQTRTSWYRSKKVKDEAIYTKVSMRWSDSIMDFGLSLLIATQKWFMMLENSIYTPEELWALTFATHLDKSRGMDNGETIGIEREDPSGKIIKVNEGIEKAMGLMIYA